MANYFNEMKESIKSLCSIESIQADPVDGKPFGEGVYLALKYCLDLAESMGFETVNYDNYIGEIVWKGSKAEKTLGILCHVDVVKAGRLSDWENPPFSPVEKDGKIIARGAMDDKGPAICTLYMMKELKDEGFVPENTVKLILGCNEESGWACIDHYNKVAKMPDFGFSPDGEFPVLYAEKGIMHCKFEFECSPLLKEIGGGEMPNMVCDYAYTVAPINDELIKKHGLSVNGDKIESFGIAAHGSTPEKGKNAIDALLKYLCDAGIVDNSVYASLFDDCYQLKSLCDETGYLTMSPDIISGENGKFSVVVDFRYPSTKNPEKMEELVGQIAPYTMLGKHQRPLFNDKESALIKSLLKIYNDESGENAKPLAIGGGTYARALPIGVAFGPEMPNEPSTVHQANEYISIDTLKFMCKVYKKAIAELSKQ